MMRHAPQTDFKPAERVAAPRPHAFLRFLPLVALVLAAIIFIIDTFIAIDIAIAVLYVAIVLMSITFADRRGVLAVAAACMELAG